MKYLSAIEIAKNAQNEQQPIYILGMIVHNQYIAGGARTQIIDNLNAKNMNLILPKYIRDRKLYPSETNNGENLWEKIDINTRYIKFLNNTPIIDLNNLYVNSVNKLFNIDILVSEGYFGFYYFYKNLPLITNLNYQPIKVNIRNINPAQNKIIKVKLELDCEILTLTFEGKLAVEHQIFASESQNYFCNGYNQAFLCERHSFLHR